MRFIGVAPAREPQGQKPSENCLTDQPADVRGVRCRYPGVVQPGRQGPEVELFGVPAIEVSGHDAIDDANNVEARRDREARQIEISGQRRIRQPINSIAPRNSGSQSSGRSRPATLRRRATHSIVIGTRALPDQPP